MEDPEYTVALFKNNVLGRLAKPLGKSMTAEEGFDEDEDSMLYVALATPLMPFPEPPATAYRVSLEETVTGPV
jgi:hypothetical protein